VLGGRDVVDAERLEQPVEVVGLEPDPETGVRQLDAPLALDLAHAEDDGHDRAGRVLPVVPALVDRGHGDRAQPDLVAGQRLHGQRGLDVVHDH